MQDGFKYFQQYLDNVRDVVDFVCGLGLKIQEFTAACERFDLPPKIFPTDINTRWNATYFILDTCLPYEEVITAVYNSSSGTSSELLEVN